MKVNAQILKKENAKATLSVGVDNESVSKEFERVSTIYQNKSHINGFRPGKTPLSVVKAKFSEQIKKDVLQNIIPSAVKEALAITEIEAFSVPKVKDIKIEEGSPLNFVLEVELPPEVTLCKYTDLTFFRDEYKISKKDVESELKKLQESYADYLPKENNIVEENDIVTLKIEAYLNGTLLKDVSSENYKTEVKKEKILEQFYNILINSKVGEEKEIEVEYPKDFNDKILAGKKIKYKILIKEVRKKHLPELDDEFAKDVGEYSSLKELKESIERQLKELGRAKAEEKLESEIIEKIINDAEFKIPESMINAHTNYLLDSFTRNLAMRGYNLNEMMQNKTIDFEKIKEQFRQDAIKDLKVYLALKNIREKEGIEVTQEEIDNEIRKYAEKHKQNFDEYKAKISESTIESLKQQIGNIKVINFLKSHNKIKKGKKHKFAELEETMEG